MASGLLAAILDLENRHSETNGEPTLGRALALATREWLVGNRDRELRLHLLFFSWYCNLEPPHLTGCGDDVALSSALPQLFHDVYATFEDTIKDDAECLYVVGLMARLTPWLLGEDVGTWEARSAAFRVRYRELLPNGLQPTLFEGRGAYGEYFGSQVAVPGGF